MKSEHTFSESELIASMREAVAYARGELVLKTVCVSSRRRAGRKPMDLRLGGGRESN